MWLTRVRSRRLVANAQEAIGDFMTRIDPRAIAVPLAILSIGLLGGADWTRFRGPDASGISADKGLPVRVERHGKHRLEDPSYPGRVHRAPSRSAIRSSSPATAAMDWTRRTGRVGPPPAPRVVPRSGAGEDPLGQDGEDAGAGNEIQGVHASPRLRFVHSRDRRKERCTCSSVTPACSPTILPGASFGTPT